jgi:hypothetical protein
MQGREIDLEKLIQQNELMPAIGNMQVNARGDELGPGGQIVRRREEVISEYYENTNAPAQRKTTSVTTPVVESIAEPVVEAEPEVVVKTKKIQTEE